eukprot:5386984-Amphidinium_carterae.3
MVDTYGRFHETKSIDIRFVYTAEGKDVGSMTYQEMWFEERRVRKDGVSDEIMKEYVMVTAQTATQIVDPFNGTGPKEEKQTNDENEIGESVSAVGPA